MTAEYSVDLDDDVIACGVAFRVRHFQHDVVYATRQLRADARAFEITTRQVCAARSVERI